MMRRFFSLFCAVLMDSQDPSEAKTALRVLLVKTRTDSNGKWRGGMQAAANLAGADGSGLFQIGLQAALDLHGGIARAKGHFFFSPIGKCRRELLEKRLHAMDATIIGAHHGEAAVIVLKFGGE